REKVEFSRLSRLDPKHLGLLRITAYSGDPAARAAQLFTFDFHVATRFEVALDYLTRANQIQGAAAAGADAERLSSNGVLRQMQLRGARAIRREPADRDDNADVNQLTHS